MLVANSEVNQQRRKHDPKTYEQQIEELNKSLEDFTQSFEILKTSNS